MSPEKIDAHTDLIMEAVYQYLDWVDGTKMDASAFAYNSLLARAAIHELREVGELQIKIQVEFKS